MLMARQDAEDRFVFENDFVIFDEAHMLEAVAASSAGGRLSRHHLSGLLWRLYNAKTRKGLLSRQKKELKSLCTRTEEQVREFFDEVYQTAVSIDRRAYEGRSRVIRVRNSHLVLEHHRRSVTGAPGRAQESGGDNHATARSNRK